MNDHPDAILRMLIRSARCKFTTAARGGQVGTMREFPPRILLGELAYAQREEFLRFADQYTGNDFGKDVQWTSYFRAQAGRIGTETTIRKCENYRRLLNSIRDDYKRDRGHAPVIVMDGDLFVRRLDGTHRISILRFLGYPAASVLTVTEDEYATATANALSTASVRAEIVKREKWYQAIELVPGVWTRDFRPLKEGMILPELKWMCGEDVIDLGCNNGLYSMEAAIAGARAVLGLDKRKMAIENAEMIRAVWDVTRPPAGRARFECGNIFDRLDIFRGRTGLIAACVLYHLGDRLDEVMSAIESSSIRKVIVQGNHGRRSKFDETEWTAIEGTPITKRSTARRIFRAKDFIELFALYGFQPVKIVDGSYPVVKLERSKK